MQKRTPMARRRLIRLGLTLAGVVSAFAAQAGIAGATPVFLTPLNVSDAGGDAFQPEVAEDSAGNVLMVWTRFDGSNFRIQAKSRSPGGAFGVAQTLSDPGGDASEPKVAFGPAGDAIAVWSRFDGTTPRIQYALRPAGGSFGAPQTISAASFPATGPDVSIDSSGQTVLAWSRDDGTGLRVEAAVRPPGGSFGAVQTLSEPGADGYQAQVAAGPDADVNAAVVWTRFDGTALRVQSSRRRDVVGFPRPRGATPLSASLVPAYKKCTSSNRTHGAPLASASCAPPAQGSSVLTMGTPDANGFAANGSGSVLLQVLAGNPSNPIDDADVLLTVSMTDVRNRPSGTDYTGKVLLRASLQITDRNNAAENPETGTVQVIPLQLPVSCTPTASTSVGSTCSLRSTIDAAIPGTIVENQRSIWELGQIEIYDAGPNGTGYVSCPPTCGDGDEAAFMRQGVFAP